MDQVTTGAVPDDEELTRFGYRQQFVRSLRHFESFAVAFSFISITTGIFTTYAFALATGGTRADGAAADRGGGPVAGALVEPDLHRTRADGWLLQLARPVHAGHAARRVHHRGL